MLFSPCYLDLQTKGLWQWPVISKKYFIWRFLRFSFQSSEIVKLTKIGELCIFCVWHLLIAKKHLNKFPHIWCSCSFFLRRLVNEMMLPMFSSGLSQLKKKNNKMVSFVERIEVVAGACSQLSLNRVLWRSGWREASLWCQNRSRVYQASFSLCL